MKQERRTGEDIRRLVVVDAPESVRRVQEALVPAGYEVWGHGDISAGLGEAACRGAILLVGEAVWRRTRGRQRDEFFANHPEIFRLLIADEGTLKGNLGLGRFHGHVKKSLGPEDVRQALVRIRTMEKVVAENEELREFVERASRELTFFIDVGRSLTSTTEPDQILEIVLDKIRRLIRAERWSIYLVDETGEVLYSGPQRGQRRRGRRETRRIPLGHGVVGGVALSGEPVNIADVACSPDFDEHVDAPGGIRIRSLMAVPIRTGGNTIGVLEVINRKDGLPFGDKDFHLVQELVDQAAIAIERARIYQKMAEMVVTDDLTKLFNLRYLNRTVDIEMERSRRYGTPLSVIFMDVDHFKDINDTHGHLVGSKVLVELARVLIDCLRTVDIVSRYGGDEFVVVLPQTPVSATFQIAQRLRRTIEDHVFLREAGLSIRLTSSFGIASFPEHANTREELLTLADRAMYQAKNKTRNCVFAIEPAVSL